MFESQLRKGFKLDKDRASGISSLSPWVPSPGSNGSSRSISPSPALPNILERLRGSPARLEERVRSLPPATLTARHQDTWSIQENIGHLRDLEPLWIRRAEQVLAGETELAVADLTNRGTDEANHNAAPLDRAAERVPLPPAPVRLDPGKGGRVGA